MSCARSPSLWMSSPPRRSLPRQRPSLSSSSLFLSADDVSCTNIYDRVSAGVANSHRDDDSYRAAKELVESGSLGEIHAVETNCLDQQDPTGKPCLAFTFFLRDVQTDRGFQDSLSPSPLNLEASLSTWVFMM